MNKEMRLDPETTSSNGTQSHANGSTLAKQKNGVVAPTANGHSSPLLSPTNSKATPYQNGHSTSVVMKPQSSFYGHDREEVIRLLIQGLGDLGYQNAANILSQESGYEVESPAVASFREAILQGRWSEAESLLFGTGSEADGGGVHISNGAWHNPKGLRLAEQADADNMKFNIREQKYLELLENEDTSSAMMVLRHQLQPLHHETSRLGFLSNLLPCSSAEEVRKEAHWDGAHGSSRQHLLQDLSKWVSPSIMIPEHRLAVLLDQVKQSQIARCLYHNPSTSPSLFADHMCDRSQFPLQTLVELHTSDGEVYCVSFSHDGGRLAAGGSDNNIYIYDTNTWAILRTLSEHTAAVAFLSWSPDDSRIISCSQDHTARVWDTNTGRRVFEINHHCGPVTTACWAPDGQTLVTGSLDKKHQLCLWGLHGRPAKNWDLDYRIQGCAISPNGQRMVTISSEKQITIYDFASKEKHEIYSMLLRSKMSCVSISRDSKYLLVNLAEDEVQLIDIETAEIVRRFLGQRQQTFVIRSCFGGADENLIISGSEDSRIYIWHKENGTLIETLEGHEKGCVNAVAWNPTDPGMFASAGDDGTVRIWSKESNANPSRRRVNSRSSSYRTNGVR